MTNVEAADETNRSEVIDFLRRTFVPRVPAEVLGGLFSYHWSGPQKTPNRGFILRSEGKIVGFLGAVYATRVLRGLTISTCNLSTWYVEPEHRHAAVKLLYAVMRQKDYSVTNFTSSPRVGKLMEALGFKIIGRSKSVFLPWHVPKGLSSWGEPLTSNPHDIAQYLGVEDRQYLSDHASFRLKHYLLRSGGDYCYIVLKRRRFPGSAAFPWSPVRKVKLMWYPGMEVLYISDSRLAVKHWDHLVGSILRREKVLGVVASERFFGGHPPRRGGRFDHREYLLERVPLPATVDSLYSEFAVLPIY